MDEAQTQINDTIDTSLSNVDYQRHCIFQRLAIDESDDRIIDEWLTKREDYLDLKKRLSQAEAIRDNRRQVLAQHEHLLELAPVELQSQIEEQQTIADKRDALSEDIATIENAIMTAKGGHALSDALESRDAAAAKSRRGAS